MAALLVRRQTVPPWCPGLSWRPLASARPQRGPAAASRWRSTTTGDDLGALLERVSEPPRGGGGAAAGGAPVHIVRSTGRNPFANLAVEHRLFERAHPESRLLLLYRNAPCVVIGRNQNPWTEVNLGRLSVGRGPGEGAVQLVRRRSGGGAVYHDAGNANWSVHIPAAGFDRDQHALMVARALRRLGVASARVNERHDIVIGGGGGAAGAQEEYKVSGSAYKLTSRRALHHGTCLLGADLAAVSGLLRAPPAAPYLKARGVASVRSPVRNVTLSGGDGDGGGAAADGADGAGAAPGGALDPGDRFGAAVAAEFERMYGPATSSTAIDVDALALATASAAAGGFAFDPQLAKGYAELMTADWLFGQTPQFTFSTQPTDEDPRARPPRPLGVPPRFDLAFTARHGRLQDVVLRGLPYAATAADAGSAADCDRAAGAALEGQVLYAVHDWRAALTNASPVPLDAAGTAALGAWLDELFGARWH